MTFSCPGPSPWNACPTPPVDQASSSREVSQSQAFKLCSQRTQRPADRYDHLKMLTRKGCVWSGAVPPAVLHSQRSASPPYTPPLRSRERGHSEGWLAYQLDKYVLTAFASRPIRDSLPPSKVLTTARHDSAEEAFLGTGAYLNQGNMMPPSTVIHTG